MSISQATLDHVLAAVPPAPGKPVRDIHTTRGIGSVITTRHALRALVGSGLVSFTGPDSQRRYFKKED
jgi:hypothetical protein